MSDTVLAHIAGAITQKENVATEAVAFILNRSAPARAALHAQIAMLLGDVAPISRIATQTAVGVESRPDLLLHGDGGDVLGYVEAKFWAALTNAQPLEYVKRLSAGTGGVLVLLAPERRLPTLRAEVLERVHALAPVVTEHCVTLGSCRSRGRSSTTSTFRDGWSRSGCWSTRSSSARSSMACSRSTSSATRGGPLTPAGTSGSRRPEHGSGCPTTNGATAVGHRCGFGSIAARGDAPISSAPSCARGQRGTHHGRTRKRRKVASACRSFFLSGVEKDAVIASVVHQLRELDELMRAAGMPALTAAAPPAEE